jgi:hypothetical protein
MFGLKTLKIVFGMVLSYPESRRKRDERIDNQKQFCASHKTTLGFYDDFQTELPECT